MSAVFFQISPTQEGEVKKMMKEEGYTNKAEFFRFLIKFYKYHKTPAEKEFEQAAKELGEVLTKLNKQGKLNLSLEEQLEDV